jgi:hypothetical protein
MKNFRILCLLLALPFMSCLKLSSAILQMHEGDGKITVDTRNPGEFQKVDIDGSYDVTIIQGPQSEVRIETDQNLLSHITSTIKDGELTISSEGNLRPTKNVAITITSPNYESVIIEGSSDVKASTPITSSDLSLGLEGSGSLAAELHAQHLKTEIVGSGDMKLSGDTRPHSLEINGSGDLAAAKLLSDTAKIALTGSGDASVNVTSRLSASIAGSGSVRYLGDVKDVHSSIAGSGSVDRSEK